MNKLFEFDKKQKNDKCLIGTDEAGRGPLAGCVVAAAVCFQDMTPALKKDLSLLNDSKKLTPKRRNDLYEIIKQYSVYSICEISVDEIENINILKSSLKAMKLSCLDVINKTNENTLVLVDGNRLIPNFDYNQKTVVKGDATSASIAAASILAKVYRDNIMLELDEKYPEYDFKNNKGYGTKKHIDAIFKYGLTPVHRKSFLTKILNQDKQLQLDFNN